MKQTAIYAALQFIMAQTGYRDTQLPIDGDAWAQSDQAAWQVLATDKLNVPPHIAHEAPTSLEVLSTYKSVIPEWLDLVKAAGEHAALIEGETYEPPAGSTDEEADDEDEGDLDGDLGQDADAPADDPQEPVADEPTVEAPAAVEETAAPATVGETTAPAADAVADAEPAAEAPADSEDSEAAEEAASHGVDMNDDPEDILADSADESNEAEGV
jgi:hypothetical protein